MAMFTTRHYKAIGKEFARLMSVSMTQDQYVKLQHALEGFIVMFTNDSDKFSEDKFRNFVQGQMTIPDSEVEL